MITRTQEIIALVEHIIAFICNCLTVYFNNNSNIQFLSFMDMGQHLTKIVRILTYGFELKNSPPWYCYLNAFLNHFTHNSVLTLSCIVIFNLYAAIVFPIVFSKYHKKIRPYIFIFVVIYNGIFIFASLYEPIFIKYSPEQIANSHNCSSGYRYKLYQYILTSAAYNLPFSILSIFCTVVIINKIRITPRNTLKNQITTRTKISFSRWIKILSITVAITLISFLNLYSDIQNGINSEKYGKKEYESLGITYYLTASSGILIFLFTNSRHQIKKKLGYKDYNTDTVNYDLDYRFSNSKSLNNSTNNSSRILYSNNRSLNNSSINSSMVHLNTSGNHSMNYNNSFNFNNSFSYNNSFNHDMKNVSYNDNNHYNYNYNAPVLSPLQSGSSSNYLSSHHTTSTLLS